MITFLASMLVSNLKASPKVAKIGAWAIVIGLIVAVLSIGKWAYDANVIEEHEAKVNLETEKADRKADNNAAERRQEDQARAVTERRELEEVNAKVTDPVERRVARLRCIELQRQARAANRQPPACI